MPSAEFAIEGETAVVTAGGSGIGRQIAAHLTDAGVDVGLNNVDPDARDEAAAALADNAGDVRTVPGDAPDPEGVERVVETTVEAFGGVDGSARPPSFK